MTSVIMAVVEAVPGHAGEVAVVAQPMQLQCVHPVTDDRTVLLGLDGLAMIQVQLERQRARVGVAGVTVLTDAR